MAAGAKTQGKPKDPRSKDPKQEAATV
ncbi:hypothetical protein CCOS01_01573 [Colletotrichum costaricense]|uniref:Uncharacterized protein n=1 Tax=Colletotrichum costaricense TaxID=1209916 RepID=A0AAJ0E916_9PEZI|nr:hypothetical protein CCOS01_01573 [Colletotrichum costaricense]